MAEHQNFRTAFNGFNRDDVVQYIEELNARHAAEVNQLNADLQYLQDKLDALESAAPVCSAPVITKVEPVTVDSGRVKELEAKLAEAEAAAKTAKAQLDDQKAENLRLQVLLDAALARQTEANNNVELDTYRRAERVERDARNRAREVSDKANAALSDATSRVDDTAIRISELTDAAMQQLKQLQLAISGSKQVLRDTATALYAIRPEDEE